MRYGFGIDLGGTTVKMAYFNQEGILLDKWEIPTVTKNAGAQILPDIAAAVKKYIADHKIDKSALLGIGIGVPGPVNANGIVNKCHNLGWEQVDIENDLQALTDLPVKAGNDASLAALGESWKGGGAGRDSMLFVTLGTGVGGGVVIGGRVIHGTHGAAGEIGHIILNREEELVCTCGKRGCVEQYCSATGIVRLAHKYLNEKQTPSTLRNKETFTCKDVFDAAAAQDTAAREILEQVYSYMGEFLADICNVIDPAAIVLGGGVSKAGAPLLEGTKRYFEKFVFHAISPVHFSLATLGNDAGAYGAFKLILDTKGE